MIKGSSEQKRKCFLEALHSLPGLPMSKNTFSIRVYTLIKSSQDCGSYFCTSPQESGNTQIPSHCFRWQIPVDFTATRQDVRLAQPSGFTVQVPVVTKTATKALSLSLSCCEATLPAPGHLTSHKVKLSWCCSAISKCNEIPVLSSLVDGNPLNVNNNWQFVCLDFKQWLCNIIWHPWNLHTMSWRGRCRGRSDKWGSNAFYATEGKDTSCFVPVWLYP